MIITACSLNGEFWGEFHDDASEEKLVLNDYGLILAGSSAIVAVAAQSVGSQTSVIGLVGPPSLATTLLHEAAKLSCLNLHTLPVLDETSFAFSPINRSKEKNKVSGKKGKVISGKIESELAHLHNILESREKGSYGVMTGLRLEELPIAREVFRKIPKGKRVVSPRTEFCSEAAFRNVLKDVDCVVLNEIELRNTGVSALELCSIGPRLVVVTQGKNGGYCQFKCRRKVIYEPVERTEGEAPGTGDWFLGSFLAYLDRLEGSFLTFELEVIEEALHFAATVAGRKAPIPGASNGPELSWIRRQLLCEEKVALT